MTTTTNDQEFTPTTEQVEFGYAIDPVAEYNDPITDHITPGKRAFRRWLAAHDAEVRAEERAKRPDREQFTDEAWEWSNENPYGGTVTYKAYMAGVDAVLDSMQGTPND